MENIQSIQRILIANRGEIACRIIRTCQDLGIETVAVFANADKNALFVQMADKAIALNGDQVIDTYLNQDKIIAAAHQIGADAIHPGYGFLSENADFAQRCIDENLIWVGPRPDIIAAMGLKSNAKQLMKDGGVPVIDGYDGEIQEESTLIAEAMKIGFPLLIKASAGGGGKGMRIVENEATLQAQIQAAKREAKAAFGNDHVLLERYFPSARHIEFQILGDKHGNVVHLYERECTIQRRYQKVIEESPSPSLNEATRTAMANAAIKAAQLLNYDNAGTVEFIFIEETQEFYFLEVNTRLQVEHPVTEAITGLDLVALQIQIVEGEKLPFQQSDIHTNGYALECRLYAEDPTNDFLPAIGNIYYWDTGMNTLRYDSGIESGQAVSIYFDPMLAKVIAHGRDRRSTFRKMQKGLKDLVCLGVTTNKTFLQAILAQQEVQNGAYDTHYLKHLDIAHLSQLEEENIHQAILTTLIERVACRDFQKTVLPNLLSGWRNNHFQDAYEHFAINGESYKASYRILPENSLFVTINDQEYRIHNYIYQDHKLTATINDIRQTTYVATGDEQRYFVQIANGNSLIVDVVPRFPEPEKEQQKGAYIAPMPSEVLDVLVTQGQEVKEGDALAILVSMKMENTILAHTNGTVKEVLVEKGEQIAAETILFVIE